MKKIGGIFLAVLCVPISLWISDRIWPLPLHEIQVARTVLAEDGTPIWRFADKEGIWRFPVEEEQVSHAYIEALLTYEDRWFYYHIGVNPFSILRALWQNVTSGNIVSGGSTLSMQVARLIDPHERTLFGKLKQLFRTFQLEWHLSKKEILTLYLNRAPFGGTLQGIGAASWSYFAKPASELTHSEAALLAVLPQAPSRLRPDRYPERAKQARNKLLKRLLAYSVWSEDTVKDIIEEPIFMPERYAPNVAPHFARRVANVYSGNVLKTTLDFPLQLRLEEFADNIKNQLPDKNSIAILVVEHDSMKVKGYVGAADFYDAQRQGQVDMVTAIRSPGSTLKPFIYALAMDEGLIHSESLLQDIPRRFGRYRPSNFDSEFNGVVSVSEALARSLNLPAVQLLEAFGAKRFAAKLSIAGLKLIFPRQSEPNLSLILGGTGTRMDQLVTLFSALARKGRTAEIRYMQQSELVEMPLMSESAAWIIRRLLSGNNSFLPTIDSSVSVPLAWKTGTSYGYRDAWAVGVNSRYVIAVWVGRADGTAVPGQSGTATAMPLLFRIERLLSQQSSTLERQHLTTVKPSSVTQKMICWPMGQTLSSEDDNCRQRRYAWVIDNTTPPTLFFDEQESILGGKLNYWINQTGKRVAADCSNATQKHLDLWPSGLESWLPAKESKQARLPEIDETCPPVQDGYATRLTVTSIENNSILKKLPNQQSISLPFRAEGGIGRYSWFLDGVLLFGGEQQREALLTHTFTRRGEHQIVVMDESSQVAQVRFRTE